MFKCFNYNTKVVYIKSVVNGDIMPVDGQFLL
jgi:hypothetical protein